jgi:putative addiction module component (TIGR02574 family)
MTTTTTPEADEIIERAMQLSAAEREAIALRLLVSVEPPNSYESPEALRAELQRRWDAIQSGADKTYSIAETMAYLRNRLAGEGAK